VEPKSDNPFIKFRQFADSQISSLLQGVLGLPSAFSKSSENSRWPDIDDDLRRRDELLARQQALRDSEAQRVSGGFEEEPVEIPVKTSSGWQGIQDKEHDRQGAYQRLGHGSMDLPLYSSVEKNLFRSVPQPLNSKTEWATPTSGLRRYIPYYLEPNQLSEDIMETTRAIAYNNLNQSSRFRSHNSLLPYLLFSPYSPMRLQAEQLKTSYPSKFDHYHMAFADLIATTSSRPGVPRFRPRDAFLPWSPFPLQFADLNMQRIDWLYESGLLQDLEIPDSHTKDAESVSGDAVTEQEMYDAFLRLASLPAAAASTFESLFKEIGPSAEERIESQDTSKFQEQRAVFEKERTAGLELLEELLTTNGNPFREEKRRAQGLGVAQDSNRVVSTRTMTEHFSHEDGTVETCVTVERTFGDGRVTTTSTSQIEDASSATTSRTTRDTDSLEGKEESSQNKLESKKVSQKGWFWN
jgi:hypothetical protein